ncbi:unnamed protein product [Diplocarpon coronariae]
MFRSREVSEGPQSHNALNAMPQLVSGVVEADAREKDALEEAENRFSPLVSSASTIVRAEGKIVSWMDGDAQNPYNWSTSRKIGIVIIGIIVVINSTMGSSLPSNAIPIISEHFNVTSPYVKILLISMYLLGYVLGPLLFGPLSESYGRRVIMLSTFFGFTVFTMACALAPNYASLLVFRLLTGVNASSPISVVGGLYADIYNDPASCVGPLIAPAIAGFVAPTNLGWRWVFWLGLIVAGVSWIPTLFLPETYGPVLLARRAAALRKSTRNPNIFAPIELEKKGWKQMATVTLARPLRMLFFELLVLATCLYVSLAYGIFYMYFEAYPIVFQGVYGQSLGVSGLMFLPIGVGTLLAIGVFLWWDAYLRRAQLAQKPWTLREESRRLPLACIGGPLYVIALFWLGWTSRPTIPFYVPMLAGLPFGMGFVLIFMALLNYLTDAYEIFAASAMAAASCARSLAGAVLPFASEPMYRRLGVPWASSLLAFASLGMCAIPWVFLWQGDRIRAGSQFCRLLKERKEREKLRLEREKEVLEEGGSEEKLPSLHKPYHQTVHLEAAQKMPYLHSRDPAAGPVYLIRPGMGVSIVHRPPIDQDGDPVGFPGMRLIVLDNRVYTPLYKLFDFSRGQADNLIEAEYRSAAEVVVYDEDIDDTFDVLYDPTQPGLVYVKYQTILYIQLPGVDAVRNLSTPLVLCASDADARRSLYLGLRVSFCERTVKLLSGSASDASMNRTPRNRPLSSRAS